MKKTHIKKEMSARGGSALGRKKDRRDKKPNRQRQAKKNGEGQSLTGVLHVSTGGIGFFSPSDGTKDLRVDDGFLGTGLHGDMVQASVSSYWRNTPSNVHVEKVLERKKSDYVGTLEDKGAEGLCVKPQDPHIHVNIGTLRNKKNEEAIGKKVLVRIVSWNDPKNLPQGEIMQVIGTPNTHETEMLAVLLDKGIQTGFSRKVEEEATSLKQNEKNIMNEALQTRLDYRGVPTCTIDPDDAKDFDDALSFKILENGDVEIGVHIADASHYVQPGTELDTEAIKRGTSTYLVDRTIPMLPEILSNDLCSLNPNEDKLAFSVIFTFNKDSVLEGFPFRIKKYIVEKTVIRSDKRFSYEEAQGVLDKKEGVLYKELSSLNILAKKIAAKNKKDGALSFSQEEVKFVLDEQKRPVDVLIKKLGETNELIESFMLLANRTVTEYINKIVPEEERLFFYRIHDRPDKERVLELISLLRGLGYVLHMTDDSVSSDEINQILEKTEGTPEANMVHMATIRSMAKAIYSIQNIGHFGLAFENYTHFTSPIRRYPDIIVHRLIQAYKNGERIPENRWETYKSLAVKLSEKEKNAMEAERGSVKYKQTEYMQSKKDDTFEGIITGITKWGLYVEEKKTKSDGLVKMESLTDDHYIFERSKMSLVGTRTKKQYRLGDSVKIKVKTADINNKTIEYTLI